jgi:hypothetical protein
MLPGGDGGFADVAATAAALPPAVAKRELATATNKD